MGDDRDILAWDSDDIAVHLGSLRRSEICMGEVVEEGVGWLDTRILVQGGAH